MADARLLRRTFVQLGVLLAACGDDSESSGTSSSSTSGAGGRGSGGAGGTDGAGGTGGEGGSPPIGGFTDLSNLGPLQEPDENGLRLPAGFTSRIIARSSEMVGSSGYVWHSAPDGGATFPTSDGGWIYTSNSELNAGLGGVGAMRFDAEGQLVDAYSILTGTSRNCAGGPTPWGTWLSCEEFGGGQVWECYVDGQTTAVVRPGLGVFSHEAVAVDPATGHLYLTEDRPDGRLYRFRPDTDADLSAGVLEAAEVSAQNVVSWLEVPDPSAANDPTRNQVPSSTPFDGGEGIWFFEGTVFFTTKGDNRVWALEVGTGALTVLYDAATSPTPILTGVDNVTVTPSGDVLVAEDGGDMQIVVLPPGGTPTPLVQVVGHASSEVTGPAFDPAHRRLYFSSQRGSAGNSASGITFEVTAPDR